MDSRRRGKRKSPSQDIIFEVSDNDISSENSEDDCNEPEAKISKIDGNNFMLKLNEHSNLENKETLNLQISENSEQDNCVEISELISVSNSSTANSSESCSDIIVISEDNIDVLNDSEGNCSVPRAESGENSENKSVGSEIIDITDEIQIFSTEAEVTSPIDNLVSSVDQNTENTVCVIEDSNTACLTTCNSNLEEGEVDDSHIEVDELVDVVGSPLIDVEIEDDAEDESEDVLDNTKSDPCICITFSDEKMAELYKLKFLKFLQEFIELEVENSDGLVLKVNKDGVLDPSEWVVLDETLCLNEAKPLDILDKVEVPSPKGEGVRTPEKTSTKKKKKKKNKKEKELFVLDTNPSENENGAQSAIYSTKFQIDIEKAIDEDEIISKISGQSCFNCDSNHAIKDCPLPKNFARINAARQKFKAQKLTSRYHLEEDQKYGHLKPGKLSDFLREALGLRKNQLPPFIYHMRILGYPPGWLEEAKAVHSNLEMFDSEGNNVRGSLKRTPGLDPEKIVDYPGFNIPLDKNMKDEFRQYRVPPYSDTFSKQAMIEFFEKHYAKEQDDFEIHDMDLDNNTEEKEEKTAILEVMEETTLINPAISNLKEVESCLPSPSLTDLEKQKENLLAALVEENSSSNPKSVETCEDPEISSDHEKSKIAQTLSDKVPIDRTLEINIDKTEDSSTSFASPPLNTSVNSVKTSSFGTPILKSSSPYCKLPNANNFMKDVSPVINFENLPNSTGKYEQMTGVLQKVRNTLKNRQNGKS